MTFDTYLDPLADDAPCGPDLDATMDPAFDDYYFGALGRLPSYYSKPGTRRPDGTTSPDQIFDNTTVDIEAERASLAGLLERSRDIRLMVLLAQWEALAGRLAPLAETVDLMAQMIVTFGADLHPTLADGPAARRDALADLANQVTMVQPLLFTGLTGTDEVSLRKIKVAAGTLVPLQNEADLKPGPLKDALADPSNKERVEATQAALLTLSSALTRIMAACQADETAPFAPALAPLTATVDEMLAEISSARPELRPIEVPVEETTESDQESSVEALPAGPSSEALAGLTLSSHAQARQMLEACEHYYRQAEPSSAALLLITQARLLIGKPLIEALETLLPDQASKTIIDFGPQTGFALNIERLRQLSNSAPESAAPERVTEEPLGPLPVIQTGGEAAGALHTVEHYFLSAEKSSPVPILLKRARSYLHRDFQSLVDELVPNLETNPT